MPTRRLAALCVCATLARVDAGARDAFQKSLQSHAKERPPARSQARGRAERKPVRDARADASPRRTDARIVRAPKNGFAGGPPRSVITSPRAARRLRACGPPRGRGDAVAGDGVGSRERRVETAARSRRRRAGERRSDRERTRRRTAPRVPRGYYEEGSRCRLGESEAGSRRRDARPARRSGTSPSDASPPQGTRRATRTPWCSGPSPRNESTTSGSTRF